MRDILKGNVGGVADSNITTQLGGNEYTALIKDIANAVTSSFQTLAPPDGAGENLFQVARAMFIYGTGATSFQDNGTVGTLYSLTPVSGITGLIVPNDYAQMTGAQISFVAANDNTGACNLQIGQDSGSYMTPKKLLSEGGEELPAGTIQEDDRLIVYYDPNADSANGAFILIAKMSATIKGDIGTIQTIIIPEQATFYSGSSKWLKLEGNTAYLETNYPKWFEAWGLTGTTSFTTPDFDNYFFRLNADARAVGSLQDDAFQGFDAEILTADTGGTGVDRLLPTAPTTLNTDTPTQTDKGIGTFISDGVNGTPRIADETRAKNVAIELYVKIA